MNDLARPALYGAWHDFAAVQPSGKLMTANIAGPVCESGDTFARGRSLPPIAADELIAFGAAGAYGSSMSSTYNARPLTAEVLVRGDDFDVVRPRQTIEAMFADERIPAWVGTETGVSAPILRKRA
jgi:diaminopimelate decarboxylase